MKKSILLIMSVSAVFYACQNNVQTRENLDHVKGQDSISHHEEDREGSLSTVSLDNGNKWVANPETSEGIKKMIALIEPFPGDVTLHEYHSLKVKLEKEFNLILEKCTMTGEAHNQLHKYLLPMQEMFEGLNSPEIEVCRENAEALKEHLNNYDDFFI